MGKLDDGWKDEIKLAGRRIPKKKIRKPMIHFKVTNKKAERCWHIQQHAPMSHDAVVELSACFFLDIATPIDATNRPNRGLQIQRETSANEMRKFMQSDPESEMTGAIES